MDFKFYLQICICFQVLESYKLNFMNVKGLLQLAKTRYYIYLGALLKIFNHTLKIFKWAPKYM